MNKGDVIFVKSGWTSLSADAIKLGELIHDHTDKYVHVALYLGDGKIAEAQGGRKSGTNLLQVYAGHYDVGTIPTLSDIERGKLVAEAQKEYGFTYDWHLIAEIGVDILTGKTTKLPDISHEKICTTFVKSIYKNGIGLDLECGDTPDEVSRSKYLEIC